jgi:hypothetical protein
MPRVSHKMAERLSAAGCFIPRHPRGCRRNYLRVIPMVMASQGHTVEEIKARVAELEPEYPCDCKLSRRPQS